MCKLFKSGPSKIDGRQTLQNLKSYGLPKQTISLQIFKRLSSTNFTWSTLEYFVPYDSHLVTKTSTGMEVLRTRCNCAKYNKKSY